MAAVADGAGSARHSAIGSAVAARVAVETLCDGRTLPLDLQDLSAWEMHLTEGLLAAVAAVEREAVIRHLSVDDLATTLILVAATPHGVVAIQVGDGAVVVDDQNGNLTTLTIPPRGEYLNETDFLSSSNLLHIAQGKFWAEPSRNIAIFSDGLEWLALQMPQMRPHVPFFEPFFNLVAESTETNAATKELIAFLQSPRVREKAKDDLTLA